MKSKQGRRH